MQLLLDATVAFTYMYMYIRGARNASRTLGQGAKPPAAYASESMNYVGGGLGACSPDI